MGRLQSCAQLLPGGVCASALLAGVGFLVHAGSERLAVADLPALSGQPADARPDMVAAGVWGAKGHRMAARAAGALLPDSMPTFFLEARERLIYLNPEPDRWRVREAVEMDQGFSYDHYIDLENVPEGALEAPHRFAFLGALHAAGIERPEQAVGLLPYRIVELYQRLVTGWRLWRDEEDAARRGWVAERIVNDAGILGHYVTDASQPHHTTIHFDGWAAGAPNPEGFTTGRGFHARFETAFVELHVDDADIAAYMPRDSLARISEPVRTAVMTHILDAHARVGELYRLDRNRGFEPFEDADPETVRFAASRIAAGASMLATLWWSAWVESGEVRPGEPGR